VRRVLAPLALLAPLPAQAEEPPIELAFTVERGPAVLASGAIFPQVGMRYEETIGEAYPPACPRGEVEHGYRKLQLAVTQVHRREEFAVYFSIENDRDVPDPEEDRCLAARTPEEAFGFNGEAPLRPGETAELQADDGIVIRLRRIR
jgi:hypothetical protein